MLSLFVFVKYYSYSQHRLNNGRSQPSLRVVILVLALVFFIGLRPNSEEYFVDMSSYTAFYEVMQGEIFVFDWSTDNIIFDNLLLFFSSRNIPVELFFLTIAALYFVCLAIACFNMFPKDKFASYLVYLGAFSTFAYATNGIKSGAAASLFLVAISLYEKRKWLWMIVLILLSWGFHHSMIVPTTAFVVCLLVRNPKWFFTLWVLCFIIALFHVNFFQQLFARFVIEQEAGYLLGGGDTIRTDIFGGFRIDFILYSIVPIIIGWIAVFKKQIQSRGYLFLLNLYTLTNAVWLLCMYAEYTNRIAYLSWFMFPTLLIYPFLKEKWGRYQYKTFMWVAFGHLAFTLFMQYIY